MEQAVANILIAAARYGLTAVGLSIIYRVTRCLDFAQGAAYAVGAYLSYVFSQRIGLSLFAAIPLAALSCSALGGCLDWGLYRRLRRRQGGPLAVLVASLGVLVIVENSLVLIFGDITYGLRRGAVSAGWSVLGARITTYQLILIVIAAGLYVAYAAAIRKSRSGLAVDAVAADHELAAVVGIPVGSVYIATAMIGAWLSGLAGGLISLEVDMQPAIGTEALLIAVLVTIAGGSGKIVGPVFASAVFASIDILSAACGAYLWRQAIAFAGLVVFLVLRHMKAAGVSRREAHV